MKRKFKPGDRINLNSRPDIDIFILTVSYVSEKMNCYRCNQGSIIPFSEENNWHLTDDQYGDSLEDRLDKYFATHLQPFLRKGDSAELAKEIRKWIPELSIYSKTYKKK